jgi:hypothetical protein
MCGTTLALVTKLGTLNLDGTRRDKAGQIRGAVPEWPNFDSESLPEVLRALAIRGAALNGALMSALHNDRDLSTEDLERVVRHTGIVRLSWRKKYELGIFAKPSLP